MQIGSTTGNLDNANGLIRAMNGATLNLGTSTATDTSSILNGTLRSEVGSLLQVGIYDVQSKLRLVAVTVDNQGTFTAVQSSTSTVTTGSRNVRTQLHTTTAFTNTDTGIVNVLNTGDVVNNVITALNVRFDVNDSASFINEGLLDIRTDTTRTGSVMTSNAAVFSINSATATFENTGTIQVINESTSTGASAQFTSVKSIVNEGTVRIKGDAGNANASFTVTGTGNSYTQSGTGERTLLERGGLLSAETIFIDSGDLGGVGAVSGIDVIIASAGRVVVADTLASGAGAGLLTFNSHLTFDDDSQVVFALGADTAGSGRAALGAGFDLMIGSQVTLSILDLDGSALSGTTYRLFDLDGGSVTGSFALDTLPSGWTGFLTVGSDYVDFTLTSAAIPEPATAALLLGLAVAGTVGLRRRRRA